MFFLLFWEYFGKAVYEWNPAFSEDGQKRVRFAWEGQGVAEGVSEASAPGAEYEDVDELEPIRSRVFAVLDKALGRAGAEEYASAGVWLQGDLLPRTKYDGGSLACCLCSEWAWI